eukprot:3438919-Prymnesium_polylepis.1
MEKYLERKTSLGQSLRQSLGNQSLAAHVDGEVLGEEDVFGAIIRAIIRQSLAAHVDGEVLGEEDVSQDPEGAGGGRDVHRHDAK